MLGLAWRPEWHMHRCLPEQLQALHPLPSRAGGLLGAPPWPMLAVPACPRAPAPPTPFPRLGLAPAAHLQEAGFPRRSLPTCWVEPMLWAGAGGGGWGCEMPVRFCLAILHLSQGRSSSHICRLAVNLVRTLPGSLWCRLALVNADFTHEHKCPFPGISSSKWCSSGARHEASI